MTKQDYIMQVTKSLQCSPAKKAEIKKQLDSDIETALEEGKPMEEILRDLGEPNILAAEFNENLGDSEGSKEKKRNRIFAVLGILLAVIVVAAGWLYWRLPKQRDIYASKIFDAEELQSRAEEVIRLFSEGDYETLNQYLSPEVRAALEQTSLETVKSYIGDDWGTMLHIGNAYMAEVAAKGEHYANVQMNVSYENVSVTFTFSFKESMELYGFYVK